MRVNETGGRPAFNSFCHEFPDEQQLLTAFAGYSAKILAKGFWIDPRTYVLEFIQERLSKLQQLSTSTQL